MATKSKTTDSETAGAGNRPDLAAGVKESAQQIWLAGLGAFAKAQEEGSKVFDTLVKEGVSMQRKTQAAASEKMTQASSKMERMATDIGSRASGQWDKLETIFEGRVAKAMGNLGMPTQADAEALNARIAELERKLARTAVRPAPAKRSAAKAAAPAPAAKRKPARKTV
jgi:poly(hydroxyalkanoate) granule-associated protein